MNDSKDTARAGRVLETFQLTVSFAQCEDGRIEYWVVPDEQVQARGSSNPALLWLRAEPFALMGICALQKRLVERTIVAALDEVTATVRETREAALRHLDARQEEEAEAPPPAAPAPESVH